MPVPLEPRSRSTVLHAPWVAGAAAALAASPALGLPFFADDWVNLAAVEAGIPRLTPFGYFRPLYVATFRAEYLAWGASPLASRLLQIALLAVAAMLVVRVVRRVTRDAALAAWSGWLFAIHPVHVVGAAWIAARADVLSAVLALAAILFYDRWRVGARGFPVAALGCLVAAGLVKEAVVVVPWVLVLLAFADPARRAGRGEVLRGLIPVLAVALTQTVVQRSLASAAAWERVDLGEPLRAVKVLLQFATSAVVPLQAEAIQSRPRIWLAVALLAVALLLWMARRGAGRVPPLAGWAAAAFFVLLGPAPLFSFQQRFLFLPSVAAALGLAAALRAARPDARRVLAALLAVGWLGCAAGQWIPWFEAAPVSRRLVADLTELGRRPGVTEIVVANMPHRVGGAPTLADFSAALRLSGGPDVAVRPVVIVDLPTAGSETLDGPLAAAVTREGGAVEVRLRVPVAPYSRSIAFPVRASEAGRPTGRPQAVEGSPGLWRVRVPDAPGRLTAVWSGGRLVPVAGGG